MEKKKINITEHALNALSLFSWPGNVRQLRQIIHILMQRCHNMEINYEDVINISIFLNKNYINT